ncbi:MAG: outer membrane beta-barrel protein [Gemmatimonadota bacterium]|nr:outer membrane beta-barrel protein [Gemmatimonadota bacterium]
MVTLVATALFAARAEAQDGGNGFLFSEPRATLTLRGGFDHANANSGLFSFTTSRLTIDRGDFSSPTIGVDLAIRLNSRLELAGGVGFSQTTKPSAFRHFEDNNNLPIEQRTRFQRVPITLSLKAYLLPRGRTIGSFAWIPARIAPYIGAGAGVMWYRFDQRGDFIDSNTLAVFNDNFASSGAAPAAHVMAGFDVSLNPRFLLTADGRYTYAKATLGSDFANFDKIDLSGFAVTAGVAVRF